MKKCPNCKSVMRVPRGKDYICGGLNSLPTKYKGDKIKVCLKGKNLRNGESFMELTPMESLLLASILSACASHYAEH